MQGVRCSQPHLHARQRRETAELDPVFRKLWKDGAKVELARRGVARGGPGPLLSLLLSPSAREGVPTQSSCRPPLTMQPSGSAVGLETCTACPGGPNDSP